MIAIIFVLLVTGGCITITELQLPDETVKPMLTGKDCVGIYFGIGTGTVQMTEAMKTYHNIQQGPEKVMVPAGLLIRRIHSVVLKDTSALGFGQRCLEVTGEP